MHCPHCRSEYRPGFTRCADCDVDLVEHLPEDPRRDPGTLSGELVSVLRTADPGLLLVARSALEAAGIPVVTQGEHAAALDPTAFLGAGRRSHGASLLVPAEHGEEARELLDSEARAED